MPEEAGDVSQLICVVSVYSIVVFGERLLEKVCPQAIEFGESLTNQTKELGVCLFLRTTLNDHGWQLVFLSCWQLNLHQFVACFLEIQT